MTVAWHGECESWHAFGTAPDAAGVARSERRPGMICVWWRGDPGRLENNLWVADPYAAGDPEAALDALDGPLSASPAATDLRLPGREGLAAWVAAAERRGFALAEVDPLMARDLEATPSPPDQGGIRVRPADDDATHALAFEVISAVWGDPAVCQFFAPRTRTRLYLAETESGPVGAATTLRHSDGVRIFSVSTLPEHRDRGVASALLGGIAAGERAAGVPTATLRTVDGLIPFYERLGYRVVGHMRRFRRPGGPGRRAPT